MNGYATNGGTAAMPTREAPNFVPPTDVFETKDAIIMLIDMPGVDPDSLSLTLDKRRLMVAAQAKSTAPSGYAAVQVEFQDGNYERVFMLPEQADGEHIDAMFKDGVLRLTLPKASPSPAKKITVKSA